jgi:hypothetical protein
MDPDPYPGGPKTRGSGSATLRKTLPFKYVTFLYYTLLFLDFFFLSCAEAEEEASERLLSSEVSEALSSEPGLEALSSEPGLEALSSEPGLTSHACSGVTGCIRGGRATAVPSKVSEPDPTKFSFVKNLQLVSVNCPVADF